MGKGRGNAEFCSVGECGKTAHGRGLCLMHYRRWKRTGDVAGKTESACCICGRPFAHGSNKGQRKYCSGDCRKEGRRRMYRAYNATHSEKRSEYDRARIRTYDWRNRDYEKLLEYNRRRRARIQGAKVGDFSAAQLAERMSMFAGCWICGADATQVDHVKPLAKGGAHMLANLRPICAPCNVRKLARWPFTSADAAALRAIA